MRLQELLRWFVTGAFALLALAAILGNAWLLLRWLLLRPRRGDSLAPFAGALFGAAALLVAPINDLHRYWWVPAFSIRAPASF